MSSKTKKAEQLCQNKGDWRQDNLSSDPGLDPGLEKQNRTKQTKKDTNRTNGETEIWTIDEKRVLYQCEIS